MLDWSLSELAMASQVSVSAIKRVESGAVPSSDPTVAKVQSALAGAGITFLADEGQGCGLRLTQR